MRHTGRRRLLTLLVFALSLTPLALNVQTANAELQGDTFPFHYQIDASTTMAKTGQTIDVPPGEFIGAISFFDGALEGVLTLPPATFTMEVAGIGLVTATAKIKPIGIVTGNVDFFTFPPVMTAHNSFHLRIISAYATPAGIPVGDNLVGDMCRTSTPINITMSGPVNLGGASTVSGTFTIPDFQYCGLVVTQALNLLVAGPNNTFSATATPMAPPE
jgi:hypothetical protein